MRATRRVGVSTERHRTFAVGREELVDKTLASQPHQSVSYIASSLILPLTLFVRECTKKHGNAKFLNAHKLDAE